MHISLHGYNLNYKPAIRSDLESLEFLTLISSAFFTDLIKELFDLFSSCNASFFFFKEEAKIARTDEATKKKMLRILNIFTSKEFVEDCPG